MARPQKTQQYMNIRPRSVISPTISEIKKAGVRILQVQLPQRQELKPRPTATINPRPRIQQANVAAKPLMVRPSQRPMVSTRSIIKKLPNIRAKAPQPRQSRLPSIPPGNDDRIGKLRDSGKGRILVMLACGPSVNEIESLEMLEQHSLIDIMVINRPEPRIKNPKYWVFCDHSQFTRSREYWDKFIGTVINPTSITIRGPNQIFIKHKGGNGFSLNLFDGYHVGRSTTYANMQTALWMNYDKIFIFGLDMCAIGGKVERYGDGTNPDVKNDTRIKRFKFEADSYDYAATVLNERQRNKFMICSAHNPWSFATKFGGKIDHKTAVKVILEVANSLMRTV